MAIPRWDPRRQPHPMASSTIKKQWGGFRQRSLLSLISAGQLSRLVLCCPLLGVSGAISSRTQQLGGWGLLLFGKGGL